MKTNVPRPPEPNLKGFKYGDIVEHNGKRGIIHELSDWGDERYTCVVNLLPAQVGDTYSTGPEWDLSECVIVGKWTGEVELF